MRASAAEGFFKHEIHEKNEKDEMDYYKKDFYI